VLLTRALACFRSGLRDRVLAAIVHTVLFHSAWCCRYDAPRAAAPAAVHQNLGNSDVSIGLSRTFSNNAKDNHLVARLSTERRVLCAQRPLLTYFFSLARISLACDLRPLPRICGRVIHKLHVIKVFANILL
jgi:hypothetical protein